jgi:phosphatidylinositol alpha-1,6-mannosyltransferase
MKKTLLITIDFPPQKGGVANYLANFSKNIGSNNIVILANNHPDSHLFDPHQPYKILRQQLFYKLFWPHWLKSYYIAKKIIAKENIEQLLISHLLPIGYIALLLKLPYIAILHGYDILLAQKNPWKKYWAKLILAKAKLIIVNSNFTKNQVLKLGLENSKIIIVNPCPNLKPEDLNLAEKQILKNELDLHHKKILLSVGRLVERKGFDQVIRALPEVIKTIPNIIYLIVGNGPDLKRLEILAEKLKVRGNVIFCEDVPDKNLACYYDLADIFIMPARIIDKTDVEGFGIVYLEAAVFAKPVIAGQSGGVAEAVIDNQTGILVNPESVQAITDSILKLLNSPELINKLGIQGQQRVAKEFQWPIQIKKVINLL